MTHSTDLPGVRHDTLASVTGRSGRGTARQTIRIDEESWEDFGEKAAAIGMDRSSVARGLVDWFRGLPGAELPARPWVDGDETAQS
jgi:hypothetical protein